MITGLMPSPSFKTDIDEAGYRAEADINRDGTVNGSDRTIATPTHSALALGRLSSIDNRIGYHGSIYGIETLQYQMRTRVYDPAIGRWLKRDPAGYVDGMGLYEGMASSPTLTDPMGLSTKDDIHARHAARDARIWERLRNCEITAEEAKWMFQTSGSIAQTENADDWFLHEEASKYVSIKAIVNAGANTLSFGFYEGEVWATTEYDLAMGYGGAYLGMRVASEFSFGVASGGLGKLGVAGRVFSGLDMAGNVYATHGGIQSLATNGPTWHGVAQTLGGVAGVGGNAFGSLSKSSIATSKTTASAQSTTAISRPPLDWSLIPKKKPKTRWAHVQRHASDMPTKKVHGAFDHDPVLTAMEAWYRAQRLGIEPSNGTFVVPMGRRVGWEGGAEGSGSMLQSVTIHTVDGQIITAYPTR